jgi:hypothetical protein
MRRVILLFLCLFAVVASAQTVTVTNMRAATTFTGACDASAAAFISGKTFVVASDEMDSGNVNRLYVYDSAKSSPVQTIDLTPAVGIPPTSTKPKDRESDIEGAAQIGNRIYWITSHGPNKNGNPRPDRYRFFATDVSGGNAVLAGKPPLPAYVRLFDDLSADGRLKSLNLSQLTATPPEAGGFNIEGLAATKEGSLLIGLRSPLDAKKRAVIIPLQKPDTLITGAAPEARLGDPIFLDLGGRGIRDIVYWRKENLHLILAGTPVSDPPPDFALYSWREGETPRLILDARGKPVTFAGHDPESLILSGPNELMVFSDDGDVSNASGVKNKDLPSKDRTFRSIVLKLAAKK